MLGERLTASRWAVSLEDPALIPLLQDEPDKIMRYSRTRDIEDLGGVERLSTMPAPPTLVKLRPMLARYDHVEDNPAMLLSLHVDEFKNAPSSWSAFETHGSTKSLADKAVAAIPRAVVVEWGELVRQMASADGVDTPFSSPAGWLERMSRRAAIAAIDAGAAETA